MAKIIFALLLLAASHSAAQDALPVEDTLQHSLQEVTVTAYGRSRLFSDVPASVAYIGQQDLSRYSNINILPAVNANPGVRMEERSPGSYRINVRGSSLRSPFGVRNVKVYYNDIPLSDPTGFSYFNQLGHSNIASLEVIKGPASSLYGAGNGGVISISSLPIQWSQGASIGYTAGSFGLSSAGAELRLGDERTKNIVRYQHLSSDGYRANSAMTKDVLSWDASVKSSDKNLLSAHVLYTDLQYQTPGALTLSEYDAGPATARPDIALTPGAVKNKAAIYQKSLLAGVTNSYTFNPHWQHRASVYSAYVQLNNPTVRNYSRNNEPHFGGRTEVVYNATIGASNLNIQVGGELQQGYVFSKTYKNKLGNPDTLQTDDEIVNRQYFGFVQGTWQYGKWVAEAGVSIGTLNASITRLSNTPYASLNRNFGTQVSPRVALLYKAARSVHIYANVARGFSPPTSAELSPSGSAINLGLNPEVGWNYEGGLKGLLLKNRLMYDLTVFHYDLSNAIAQRKDTAGGDTYINAGGTKQKGIEAKVSYSFFIDRAVFDKCLIWIGYTGYNFTYNDFKQNDDDFSGKQLPGVAPATITAGLDVLTGFGLYCNITYLRNEKIWLNDANTAAANAYNLLTAKIGYELKYKKYSVDIFGGADNILNEQYSLGNDINAAGGRYYNAAPTINYYAGLTLKCTH